jgi:integrase
MEREFVKRWGARPVTDILPEEVADAIRAIVKRGAPYQAHNAFADIRRMFNWAIGTHEFGIASSPVERLRPADLIGKREARNRILSDDELRRVWAAADWKFESMEGRRVWPTARRCIPRPIGGAALRGTVGGGKIHIYQCYL